ncbi:MAG: hypothetical protein KF769_05510 [Parvibaculum sp.]|nr:hypothetical protein [Parvibaculum sp.]
MLIIDDLPGVTAPLDTPPFQKQIRLVDRYGKILSVEDVTALFNVSERVRGDGAQAVLRFAKSLCADKALAPDGVAEIQTLCFWPSEGKFVITSKFNVALAQRVRDARPEHDAVLERRFAAMYRGKDL